jgi:Ni,Fe-hydrogenase III small subunit
MATVDMSACEVNSEVVAQVPGNASDPQQILAPIRKMIAAVSRRSM